MTALYIIFQILTRSDDGDILSHLPAASSLRSPSSLALGVDGANVHSDVHHPYSLPYHLPHLTSPLQHSSDSSGGFWRTLLAILLYPLYLGITLLAIPMPFLVNALNLLLLIVATIFYPFTSTARVLGKAFVVGPLYYLQAVFALLYPLLSFVGGIIGVGCVMGMGAGWMGKITLEYLTKGKDDSEVSHTPTKPARSKGRGRRSSRHADATPHQIETRNGAVPRRSLQRPPLQEVFNHQSANDGNIEFIGTFAARRASVIPSKFGQVQYVEDVPAVRAKTLRALNGQSRKRGMESEEEGSEGTAREPVTVGVRRRTHAIPTE